MIIDNKLEKLLNKSVDDSMRLEGANVSKNIVEEIIEKANDPKNKLTSSDYQTLAMLANEAGYEELRLKCIAHMFKDMKVVKNV